MRGLDPGIHVLLMHHCTERDEDMDGRVKPGA